MKFRFLTIIFSFVALLLAIDNCFAALNGSSGTITGDSTQKNFSENSLGVGLSVGFRFNLAEDIFSDSEDKNSKIKDHIFSEIEAFGNQFLSGEIKQNFGGRLNLGYEINGIRIYGSGGYVASTTSYQEGANSNKQSTNGSAPFFGAGLGYDLTKNISLRLNSMFYDFDFKPKNSNFKKIEVNVTSITLGLGVYF